MPTKTITKARKTITEFDKVKNIYLLATPEQIKQRMIWNHLQMLVRQTFGESSKNRMLLKELDARFLTCEAEERRINGSSKG